MRNPLKIKIIIIGVSFSLLLSINLVQNNFYAKPTLKKWDKLTWDDFNGITQPFTKFDAAISSDIVLEYNDSDSSVIAYAVQNNQKSWKKKQEEISDYLLNHEQYHFNIAEIFARKMNEFIKNNPNEDYSFYDKKLSELKIKESKMQKLYDKESNHSISSIDQSIWEYKIDSLLQYYSNQTGFVTDFYSGAKAYFPQTPKFEKGIDSINGYSYRYFAIDKYNMELALVTFQYLIPEFEDLEESIKQYYTDNELEIKSFEKNNLDNDIKLVIVAEDTVRNSITKDFWLSTKDYFYRASARYLSKYKDIVRYTKIADNFINTFEVVNTEKYWTQKFQNTNLDYEHRNLNNPQPKDWDCLVYGEEDQYVFFKGPVFMKNGSLILIQDIPDSMNNKIKYNFLRLNNDVFQYNKIDSTDHFLYIPYQKIPERTFNIEFGYVPVEDSIKDCYKFNYQTIEITPPPQKP
ncbi:hypothetical protein [Aquimarina mytili]|uniref:DUF922 domain-containing protein n=1 Tax=Aquimarina mytili TaxID=874423 RepID=A0A936ZZN3_9FLAO|nr:hypothetical protein [Aquimarina mytili]MBL0685311.1 hypothetical protein [Aquimarina mytili]